MKKLNLIYAERWRRMLTFLAIIVTYAMTVMAQQPKITVHGTVEDAEGAIVGASVSEKGTMNGTVTNIEGNFSLSVNPNATLTINYIGYAEKEIAVKGQTTLRITMEESMTELDEIVVTALGIQRSEKALGFAVQRVSGEDLVIAQGANVVTSLTGKVAGLNVTNSTEFMGGSGMLLRGYGPLIVLDGVMFGNTSLDDIPANDV